MNEVIQGRCANCGKKFLKLKARASHRLPLGVKSNRIKNCSKECSRIWKANKGKRAYMESLK